MRGASERLLGFGMLFGTLLLWVGSSVAVQAIFGGEAQFRKPIFITLLNSAMSVSLLLPRLARSTLGVAALLSVARLSATVGLLWLCAQCVYNASLLHTSVATNTVLSSTSSVFTFLFSLLLCGDPFRWATFGSALLSFLGCALVAAEAPKNLAAGAVANSPQGDGLALLSAAMSALASVLLRRCAPVGLDLGSYMGVTGLISLGLAPGLLLAAHAGGLESFSLPTGRTLGALLLNALLGCSFANYLYASAVLLLSPFVASVFLSLSIPVSALTDEMVLGEHRFSAAWALGAAVACMGAVLAAVDFDPAEQAKDEDRHAARLEAADASEMESLLDSNAQMDGAEIEHEAA